MIYESKFELGQDAWCIRRGRAEKVEIGSLIFNSEPKTEITAFVYLGDSSGIRSRAEVCEHELFATEKEAVARLDALHVFDKRAAVERERIELGIEAAP